MKIQKTNYIVLLVTTGLTMLLVVNCALAQQGTVTGDSERGAAAIGHYARARALLVEALAEFELGRRLADPDMIIDTEQWRMTLVSRTEELNKVLDPKPRVTRSGVRFKANSRLIRQDRAPSVEEYKNMPKDSNQGGERPERKVSTTGNAAAKKNSTSAVAAIPAPVMKTAGPTRVSAEQKNSENKQLEEPQPTGVDEKTGESPEPELKPSAASSARETVVTEEKTTTEQKTVAEVKGQAASTETEQKGVFSDSPGEKVEGEQAENANDVDIQQLIQKRTEELSGETNN